MIITDKLVYIHFPKSGGTFITVFLKKLYQEELIPAYNQKSYLSKLLSKKPYYIDYKINDAFNGIPFSRDNHNGISQIPKEHIEKQIFTTIRNPFEFYVSYYETKKWITNDTLTDTNILKLFPQFPNINFTEFLTFLDIYYFKKIVPQIIGIETPKEVGLYTALLIFLYCENPKSVFADISVTKDVKETEQIILKNISDKIQFVCFSDLRKNLYKFLAKYYDKKKLLFIFNAKSENVNKNREHEGWFSYYSEDSLKNVEKKDAVSITFYNKLCGKK